MQFKLVFFSSSDFVIPILENINNSQGMTLRDIATDQLDYIQSQALAKKLHPTLWSKVGQFKSYLENPVFDNVLKLELVITQPDRENRGKIIKNPIAKFAEDYKLNVFKPEKLNKSRVDLYKHFDKVLTSEESVEILFDAAVVASYGQIISSKILESSRYGFSNWHPSLLPLYRGPIPMPASINNGDNQTGLSWIEMTKEMDAGDIWMQLETDLMINDTIASLADRLSVFGANTWALPICAKIIRLQYPDIKPIVQDSNKVTFTQLLTKEDAQILPLELEAIEVYNHWRAFMWFPGTKFFSKYFNSTVKLQQLSPEFLSQDAIKSESVIFQDTDWINIKESQSKVFLKTKNGFVRVIKIVLENGQRIDFSGYYFK